MTGRIILSLVLGAFLLAIAVIDRRSHRIPDRLSLPLIALGLGQAAFAGAAMPDHVLGAAGGYLALAGFGALHFRWRGTEGLGLGDAKLFAAAGAWLGWQALPLVLAIAAVGGLAHAVLAARARAGEAIAFGPWIALAIWICWILRLGAS